MSNISSRDRDRERFSVALTTNNEYTSVKVNIFLNHPYILTDLIFSLHNHIDIVKYGTQIEKKYLLPNY